MTLDDEFNQKFPDPLMFKQEMKDWFKSYLKDFAESVKLEKEHGKSLFDIGSEFATPRDYRRIGYNIAVSDQEAKIAQALKERGI